MYKTDLAMQRDSIPRHYFRLLWIWIAVGSIVLIEPAPHDILFVLCICIALLFSHLSFSETLLLPLLLLGLFIDANLISMFFAAGDMVEATRFF